MNGKRANSCLLFAAMQQDAEITTIEGLGTLPPSPISGGFWSTASLTPAVLDAAQNATKSVVAVHADCPEIDVTFLDNPDYNLNPVGARGVGEIGLAGVAAAITNAVYHATCVRVRSLPVRIENLLAAPAPANFSV